MPNAGFAAFSVIILIAYLFFLVIAIIAWVKIISKAGYSGWWVLIGIVPVVGAVMFLVFAFSKWPIQQRLEAAMVNNRPQIGPDGWSRGGGWSPPGGPQGPISAPQGPSAPQGWSPQLPQQRQQPPGPSNPPWN
jgi:hypothetical protein